MPSPAAPAGEGEREWPAYGGDALGSRYSPLAEITRDNVGSLRVACTFHTGETPAAAPTRRPTVFEATPIVVDGALYLTTPLGRVFALDPATGQERWRFDARVDPTSGFGDFKVATSFTTPPLGARVVLLRSAPLRATRPPSWSWRVLSERRGGCAGVSWLVFRRRDRQPCRSS